MKANKGCDKMSSKDNFFSDISFKGVKTTEKENSEGLDYSGPAKKNHKGFS